MSEKVGSLLIELGANVARLQQDMSQAWRIVQQASDQMSRALSMARSTMASLGVGLSVAGIAGFVKHAIDAADEL